MPDRVRKSSKSTSLASKESKAIIVQVRMRDLWLYDMLVFATGQRTPVLEKKNIPDGKVRIRTKYGWIESEAENIIDVERFREAEYVEDEKGVPIPGQVRVRPGVLEDTRQNRHHG